MRLQPLPVAQEGTLWGTGGARCIWDLQQKPSHPAPPLLEPSTLAKWRSAAVHNPCIPVPGPCRLVTALPQSRFQAPSPTICPYPMGSPSWTCEQARCARYACRASWYALPIYTPAPQPEQACSFLQHASKTSRLAILALAATALPQPPLLRRSSNRLSGGIPLLTLPANLQQFNLASLRCLFACFLDYSTLLGLPAQRAGRTAGGAMIPASLR